MMKVNLNEDKRNKEKSNTSQDHVYSYDGGMWQYSIYRSMRKIIDTENQYVIHRHMNENETETNRDTFEEVIKKMSRWHIFSCDGG